MGTECVSSGAVGTTKLQGIKKIQAENSDLDVIFIHKFKHYVSVHQILYALVASEDKMNKTLHLLSGV